MDTQILYPSSREEWLKIRHGYVSSTESAALFGMSPYITAYELALDKTDKLTSEFEGNERTAWGLRLQDAIAKGIGEDYGVVVRPQSGYAVHHACRMGASFDYEIVDCAPVILERQKGGFDPILREMLEKHGPGVLEIKNVDSLVYKQQWSEEAPDHIEIQVQHQLECIRYGWSVIGALVGGNRHRLLIRERDEKVGRSLVKKISAFWADLEQGKMPPVMLPEDADIIIQLYKFADPGKVYKGQEDEKFRALCARYVKYQKVESRADERKKSTKALMLQIMGAAEKGLAKGYSVSAGMVKGGPVSFVREDYRNFRVYPKKVEGEASGKG